MSRTDGHGGRGGTEVKSLVHLKALHCDFKGQGCAWCESAAESFYLHGFIAHIEEEEDEEEEEEESRNKTVK